MHYRYALLLIPIAFTTLAFQSIKGAKVSYTYYDNGKVKTKHVYDSTGYSSYDTTYRKDGTVYSTQTHQHDKEGNIVSSSELPKPTGRTLFIDNCVRCHRFSFDMGGPRLQDITQRRDHDWLVKMIMNGEALVKAKDTAALAMYSNWGRATHPNFEHLTEEDINAIIAFIDEY